MNSTPSLLPTRIPGKSAFLNGWKPEDGWLTQVKYINDELYVVLHYGDNTMGGDIAFKLEDGQLREIAKAKSFIKFDLAGDYFYYIDFRFMASGARLLRVNLKTGEKEALGDQDFSYGIFRMVNSGGGTSYAGRTFYLKDNHIYTLGYQEADEKDLPAVYKVSPDRETHQKLTLPAKEFWLVDEAIYYIDLATGYLMQTDLEGNAQKTLVAGKVIDVQAYDGNIYYTVAGDGSTNSELGQLYKYNTAAGQESKLSDHSVSHFFVGQSGVYYVAEGYDLGLYKIDANGQIISIVEDTINTYSVLLTDSGLIYTKRYAGGIYTY